MVVSKLSRELFNTLCKMPSSIYYNRTKITSLSQYSIPKQVGSEINANSAILQLYHGESKLIFNNMMIRSALY